MDSTTISALNAYQNQLKLMQNAGPDTSLSDDSKGTSFSQMMQNFTQGAIDTQYKSENVQMQAMSGKVELSDLVTAVSNAELTLNTVVAVRDRVISAYQDIIRLAI